MEQIELITRSIATAIPLAAVIFATSYLVILAATPGNTKSKR